MTSDQLYILSFYRSSELAGALLMGKLAFHTSHDELRAPLTEQCSEEARHAWLVTETITKLGGIPQPTKETFQTEIAKEYGSPDSIVDILCLTKVFEERVLDHYQKHAAMKDELPEIVELLNTMIEDEAGHVDWIEKALETYAKTHDKKQVDKKLAQAQEIDRKVYAKLSKHPIFARYFKEII